jgi:hypothetical protein
MSDCRSEGRPAITRRGRREEGTRPWPETTAGPANWAVAAAAGTPPTVVGQIPTVDDADPGLITVLLKRARARPAAPGSSSRRAMTYGPGDHCVARPHRSAGAVQEPARI